MTTILFIEDILRRKRPSLGYDFDGPLVYWKGICARIEPRESIVVAAIVDDVEEFGESFGFPITHDRAASLIEKAIDEGILDSMLGRECSEWVKKQQEEAMLP